MLGEHKLKQTPYNLNRRKACIKLNKTQDGIWIQFMEMCENALGIHLWFVMWSSGFMSCLERKKCECIYIGFDDAKVFTWWAQNYSRSNKQDQEKIRPW